MVPPMQITNQSLKKKHAYITRYYQ